MLCMHGDWMLLSLASGAATPDLSQPPPPTRRPLRPSIRRPQQPSTRRLVEQMFFMDIIMLNLLIAIMGDEYVRVQEWGHEQYLYAKAGIIIEYEARMSRAEKQDPKLFPEWLQVRAVGGSKNKP